MPGQKILECDCDRIDPKFICIICKMLLVEPMQTCCGHLMCCDCLRTILSTSNPLCPEDGTELKQEEVFSDAFMRREISQLQLQCPNSGCDWSGPYKELQDHSECCGHSLVKCVHSQCREEIKRFCLAQHLEKECNYRHVECPSCKEELSWFLLREHVNVDCLAVTVTCQYCGLGNIPRREFNKHGMECDETPVDCDFKAIGCPKVAKRKELHQHYIGSLIGHVRLLLFFVLEMFGFKPAMENEVSDLKKRLEKLETKNKKLENELWEKTWSIDGLRVQLDQISHMQVTKNQGQAPTSYSGTLVWKIDDFNRKRMEAINEVQTAVYSPPFYSDQFGYKMCARIHLNGDGFGKDTRISLFFVVMKGEYDALLPWPFQKNITMMLMDQDNGNHMIDVFRSDPQSSSFQRPKFDMNFTCESSLSIPMDDSLYNGYVKDDIMFIRIMVEN